MRGIEFTVVLLVTLALVIGAATRLFSQRTRFPYTIAMLLLGIGTGLLIGELAHRPGRHLELLALIGRGAEISPYLIIFVFLPALIFESAYSITVHTFRKNLGAILIYAVPALVLSTVMVAALMRGLTSMDWLWDWPAALVFGALISATDPVAVVAILRELGVSKRLAVLIEGESLLNDGTAIVVFSVLLAILAGTEAEFELTDAMLRFLYVVAGGLAVGAVLALVFSAWLARLFNDALSEISLTIVMAYAAMIIGEGLLHVSGVMAVVVTGLWMSDIGKTKVSPEVSHFLHRFWGTLGYIANTLIFFLVGLVIAREMHRSEAIDALVVVMAYVGIMGVRFIVTFLFRPLADRFSDGMSMADATVVSWGGLRGAVSLALALIISQQPSIDPDLRHQILLVTAGVVLLTILVNGTTVGTLLGILGYDKRPASERLARLSARAHALDEVDQQQQSLSHSHSLEACHWADLAQRLEARRTQLEREMDAARQEMAQASAEERCADAWRQVLARERQYYWEEYGRDTLHAHAVRTLARELDLQLDRLWRGDPTPPDSRVPPSAVAPGFVARLLGKRGLGFHRLALLYDLSRAEHRAAAAMLAGLDTLDSVDPREREAICATYRRFRRHGVERIEDMRVHVPEMVAAIETRLAERIALNLERDAVRQLGEHGLLDEEAMEAELHRVEHRMHALELSETRVTIPETADLVAATPLFAELDEDALRELAALTEEIVIPAGELVFRAGDVGDSVLVVARGVVHILDARDGEERMVDALGSGALIGEMALLAGGRRTATVRAATTVTLGKVTREGLDHLLATQPALRQQIWAGIGWRYLDNAARGHASVAHLSREQRQRWHRGSRSAQLAAGQTLDVSDGTHLCVIAGRVVIAEREHSAPALLEVATDADVQALEDALVLVLPAPLDASS